jgi:hypothetical protein
VNALAVSWNAVGAVGFIGAAVVVVILSGVRR